MRPSLFLANRVAEIFAADCLLCGTLLPGLQRAGVCLACWSSLPREGVTPTIQGLDGLSCPFSYLEPTQTLILKAKAAHSTEILDVLGELLGAFLLDDARLREVDGIVSAPSHPLSDLRRGYSPAREIAAATARQLRIPLLRGLRRSWRGRPFTKSLARQQRLQLDRKIFLRGRIPGPNILVIDDVVSTGQTLYHCAQALRKAGAVTVWGAAVARNR